MENNIFSINISHNKYHTVSIRSDLPKIPKYYQEEPLQNLPPNDFWMKKLDSYQALSSSPSQNSSASATSQRYEIQYNRANGPYTSTCVGHPVLTAFLHAYNSHEDIILSPDDIWIMICIYFAKYVNQNARKLHQLYINDQKTKLITIENEQTVQSDWEDFLQQVHLQMTNHVKNEICHLLSNNFSTTTKVESLLSSLIIMSTFKKSLDYTYSIKSCGIRNVHFMGTLDDWILLREKTNQLRLFTVENDDFFVYINGILPIFDQFIQTYKGNVDNQFWDMIFDLKHRKGESNQSDGMYINGWFLHFCYGSHTKQTCSMTSIELDSLIVPVQVENEHTNTLKTSYLVGGFHGVLSDNERHKPVLSLVIMDDIENITKLEKTIDNK